MKHFTVTYVEKLGGQENKVTREEVGETVAEVRERYRAANVLRKANGLPHMFRVDVRPVSEVKELSYTLGRLLLPH